MYKMGARKVQSYRAHNHQKKRVPPIDVIMVFHFSYNLKKTFSLSFSIYCFRCGGCVIISINGFA